MTRANFAFTLIELLVVIGVITVLISILLPSLAAARRSAQMTECGARLCEIARGGQLHATDHRGYHPLAGDIEAGWKPVHLNDSDRQRYTWWRVFGNDDDVIAPYQIAVSRYLSQDLSGITSYGSYLDATMYNDTPIRRWFTCPGVDKPEQGFVIKTAGFGVSTGAWGQMSYVFNEAALGIDDARGRLRGKLANARRSAETFLAMDGRPADDGLPAGTMGWLTIANEVSDGLPVTLADAFTSTGRARDKASFDARRHRGRANVAFLDGHVEAVRLEAGELGRVLVSCR